KDFWSNEGVDLQGILRAALVDLQSGRVIEGGSTITQQLIKNLIVGNDPTYTRKLREVILAPQINDHYTKSDILEMYLNSIYYVSTGGRCTTRGTKSSLFQISRQFTGSCAPLCGVCVSATGAAISPDAPAVVALGHADLYYAGYWPAG